MLISRFSDKIKQYCELVKFEHTVFALPFALSAMLLAQPVKEWPSIVSVIAVLVAMTGGRTYAMGLNRLIDARIDAQNPRTENRAIPAGRVKPLEAWALVGISGLLLVLATLTLPVLCIQLLPLAFLILTLYSYVKRFSMLAHLVLGLALAASAIGGWIAISGQISLPALLFGMTVLLWVTGFDIIYACQDYTFDRKVGLKSIPAALGIQHAITISRLCHLSTAICFASFVMLSAPRSIWLWLAVCLTGGMLLYEHLLIRGKNGETIQIEKINEAFFTVNGQISLAVFVLVILHKLVL